MPTTRPRRTQPLTRRPPTPLAPYGYARAEAVGALVNGTFLLAACVHLALEAAQAANVGGARSTLCSRGARGVVHYGEASGGSLAGSATAECTPFVVSASQLTQENWNATLTGLKPSTEYQYKVVMGGGVASLLAPDDSLPDVPAPPPRPRGINSLPRKEDIKEVSDTVATSFAQAAAPYAFGLFLLSAAFAALREIAKPLEQVVRNILAGVFLVAFGKFATDNSETILRFLDFASDLVTR